MAKEAHNAPHYGSHKRVVYIEKCQSEWAFDSEFLMSGRAHEPSDVHTVQFSNGEITVVLESDNDLKLWLLNHRNIKKLYGFVVLPDLSSISEWLGEQHVSIRKRGMQTVGRIAYGSTKIDVYDIQPMANSFGLRNLALIGSYVGIPKLDKPHWLGQRNWQTESEHEDFLKYAAQDAIITSKYASLLVHRYGADPSRFASAGTLVKEYFKFPKRLKGKPIELSPLELRVKNACFAGRSEGFHTGFTKNVYYNDVSSLYPCSIVASQCMRISGMETCKPTDLTISNDLNEQNYGWIEGVFETHNDLWGLPMRGKNNFYATGNQIYGLYHTFDIAASRAKVLHVLRAWKPIMRERDFYTRKYGELLLFRIEKPLDKESKSYTKAILNALSGKLGQSKPIGSTSNFYAYSTLLAHSHLIMSNLFDRCDSDILAMDTDSIFSHTDMNGKWFEVTDGEYTVPINIGVKGKGDLSFFRSKRYILKGEETVFGAHGWRYFLEDYLKLFDGAITELPTRMDIKHTLMTRQHEALAMAKGRWKTKPVVLKLDKLKALLSADAKRNREIWDSYELIMNHKSISSKAWDYEDLLEENPISIGN